MTWEIIGLGDEKELTAFAKLAGEVVPECKLSSYEDMKRFLVKTGDYFKYKDKDHEIILGFVYSNGKQMWRIAQLAFKGKLNPEVFKKVRDKIFDFMTDKKVENIYAVVPKLPETSVMKGFYAGINDYWKITKEQDGSLTLPLKGIIK
jgi:hypothetical protein